MYDNIGHTRGEDREREGGRGGNERERESWEGDGREKERERRNWEPYNVRESRRFTRFGFLRGMRDKRRR